MMRAKWIYLTKLVEWKEVRFVVHIFWIILFYKLKGKINYEYLLIIVYVESADVFRDSSSFNNLLISGCRILCGLLQIKVVVSSIYVVPFHYIFLALLIPFITCVSCIFRRFCFVKFKELLQFELLQCFFDWKSLTRAKKFVKYRS